MQTVGACEAKTKLPSLLERVDKGESFTITRRGVPIALLIKPIESPFPDANKAIEGLLSTRHKFARAFEGLEDDDIKAMMTDGRM